MNTSTAVSLIPERAFPGPFEKTGKDANPNGRPKMVRAVRDLAKEYTEEALLGLVEIGRKVTATDSARVAAWSEILNRAWGKAPQHVELEVTVFDQMSEESRALMNAACDYLTRVLSEQASAGASNAQTIDAQAREVAPHTDDAPASDQSPK